MRRFISALLLAACCSVFTSSTVFAEDVAKKEADKPASESTSEEIEKAVREIAEKVAREVAEKVASEIADRIAKEVADRIAKELAAEIAKELAKQAAEKSEEEAEKKEPEKEVFEDLAADSATHVEIEPLEVAFKKLSSLRLHPDGDLLACDGEAKQIKIINPAGELTSTIDLEFSPEAIDVAADGTIYCGGEGKLAKLTKSGEILSKTVIDPRDPPPSNEEKDEKEGGEKDKKEKPKRKSRPHRVSGLAVMGDKLVVAFGSSWSLRSKSKLFRFDLELGGQTLICEGLRGCCQRCDIVAAEGAIYVAENAAYRVVKMDIDGNELGKWGSRNRDSIEGFAACCNPMNLCFDAEGKLYTAESGPGRVKCYSTDGKFLSLVGYASTQRFERASGLAASCSNIAIDVTPDGSRVYVMDYKGNQIRVLRKK